MIQYKSLYSTCEVSNSPHLNETQDQGCHQDDGRSKPAIVNPCLKTDGKPG